MPILLGSAHVVTTHHLLSFSTDILALKHESRKFTYCWGVEKSSRSFSNQSYQAAAGRSSKPAGTKKKHFKLSNNPEISDLSTLVL